MGMGERPVTGTLAFIHKRGILKPRKDEPTRPLGYVKNDRYARNCSAQQNLCGRCISVHSHR
jgi:hypothetical protein